MATDVNDRYVNRQRHLCGCETVFDTLLWRSKLVTPCNGHRLVMQEQEV